MEEFLKDPDFVSWVREGKNNDYWIHYISLHPHRSEEIAAAKATILAVRSLPVFPIGNEDRKAIWDSIESQILAEDVSGKKTYQPIRKRQISRFSIAASFILISCLAGWLFFKTTPQATLITETPMPINTPPPVQEWAEISNNQEQSLPLHLPDGSSVVLKKNSRLKYSTAQFGTEKREVHLSGEAFFEVVKDPYHPFIVYTGELVTKVLGTSFTVRSYPGENEVQVLVSTGKVSVYKLNTSDPVTPNTPEEPITVLTQNQQIMVNRLNPVSELTSAHTPVSRNITVPIQTFSFQYENAYLSDIFEDIQAAYGIELAWDKQLMAHCRITGNFSKENLYEKINLICHSIDANYETADNIIKIQSSGC